MIDFIYAAGAMGFNGEGYWYHEYWNFPKFPFVTKTLTFKQNKGCKYCVMPIGNTVLNKVSLDNVGLFNWLVDYYGVFDTNNTISIYATDQYKLNCMLFAIANTFKECNVEINLSCPNAKPSNVKIPIIKGINIALKLGYTQNPFDFLYNESDIEHIKMIRLNSVRIFGVGVSGYMAKKYNWKFIKKWGQVLPVSGCSWNNMDDIYRLIDMGCKEISIGSVMITNPEIVETLG
jgi:dihydroorotate dehydrogenase